jgi:hypothetical protein
MMHARRLKHSSGHRVWRFVLSRPAILRLATLPLLMLPLAMGGFASAARAADGVELASFEDTPIDDSPADMTPQAKLLPTKKPLGKQPLAEAPLPDDTALPDGAAAEEAASPAEKPMGKSTPRAEKSTAAGKPAPREKLVIGDAYTLEVKRGSVTQSFGGNLLKANEQWIVLRRVASGQNDYGVPLLSVLPKVGSYFRRSYESLVEDDLWIPREAATIVSHRKVDTSAAARNIPANEPPPKAHCGVAFVHEDKFVRRDVQLAAIDANNVTVSMSTPFRSQYQQQIARGEILCISIPVVLSNVRMTHRDDGQARK